MNEAGVAGGWSASRWKWLLLALIAIDFAVSLRAVYMDADPQLYVVIGEGIYQLGRWPYSYAFDHKPALLYLVYGLLSYFPRGVHEFQMLAVLISLGYAAAARLTYLRGRPFWLCFVAAHVATIGSIGFSANSEAVYVPLMLAAVYALHHAEARGGALCLAALLAAVTVNCNCMAAFVLAPALLYSLYAGAAGTRGFWRRTIIFGAAFLVWLAVILALLALARVDLAGYFAMQVRFLAEYADDRHWPSIDYALRLLLMLSILPLALRQACGDAAAARLDRTLCVITVMAVVSLLLSGKFFPHYLYLVAAPAALLAVRRAPQVALPRLYGFAALCLLTGMATNWFSRGDYDAGRFMAPYAQLSARVGTVPVMALRVSIVPQYFAHVVPFQPFIMWDFPTLRPLNPTEDRYYSEQIDRGPAFVLTAPGFCDGYGRSAQVCARIASDYVPDLRFAGESTRFSHDRQQVGFLLYRRIAPVVPAEKGLNSLSPAPM